MFRMPEVSPREEFEKQRLESVNRHHRILGVGLVLLALALAGGGWYAYQALQRDEAALGRFSGVQKLIDTIGDQLKQNDLKLASWTDDRQRLRDQMAKLGQTMETTAASVTKQAQASSAEIYRRVEAEIDERFQHVDTRLTRIESSNEVQQARIAELQREVEELRKHPSKPADDLSTARSKTDEDGATH